MRELDDSQFLALLKQRSIEVSVKDGRLHISAPAGTIEPQLRSELARRKPDLLAILQGGQTPAGIDPLVPMDRSHGILQTHAQQGMWLIDHFEPGNVAYNIPEAFIVESAIDAAVFQKAVDQLLLRHESLRTYFFEEDDELLQAVSPGAKARVGFTDLSAIDEAAQLETLEKLMRDHARIPFDLNQAPLVRFHLFQSNSQRYVIFLNIHHIISDRRSLIILQQELVALYQAALGGESAVLPPLSVQFADYAIWATRQLEQGAMAGQVEYWKAKLTGAPAFLDLPSSRAYPEQRTAWGSTVPVIISSTIRDGLTAIARQEGATMFMTLLAAFALLLFRHSHADDFCLGSPFTHRKQVETESIIGLFVNMIVFRCQLQADPSFREVLNRVRITALEAYEHGEVPFQEIVRALKPDPRSHRSPLFQIMFAFDSDTRPTQGRFIPIDTHAGTARFDLTLQLGEGPNGIDGYFEYCTDLFDAESIQRLARHFSHLLQEIVTSPDLPISRLPKIPNLPEPLVVAKQVPITEAGFWKRIRKIAERRADSTGKE